MIPFTSTLPAEQLATHLTRWIVEWHHADYYKHRDETPPFKAPVWLDDYPQESRPGWWDLTPANDYWLERAPDRFIFRTRYRADTLSAFVRAKLVEAGCKVRE